VTESVRYKVLLIDDNVSLLQALAFSLEELGNFDVVSAEDGATGLEKVIETQPNCVVIDVRMPGLDGYQLVQALRGDQETADIPLVMLTAMAQDRDRFTGLAVGADTYLTKPVKPQDLAQAIRQAIETSAAERIRRYQQLAQEEPPPIG
jgi:CheY-like chemotaxis protein